MQQMNQESVYLSRIGMPGLTHVGAGEIGELNYNPAHLIEMVSDQLGLKNDAALCRLLGIMPSLLSKVRNMHAPITADLLLRFHDLTGLTIRDLRFLMGDQRRLFRPIALR